jgi:hypothetical protein
MTLPLDACCAAVHLMSNRLINVFPEPVFKAAMMFPNPMSLNDCRNTSHAERVTFLSPSKHLFLIPAGYKVIG